MKTGSAGRGTAARSHFVTPGDGRGGGHWANTIGIDGAGLRRTRLGLPVAGAAWGPDGSPLVFVPNLFGRPGHGPGPDADLWLLAGLASKPHRLLVQRGGERYPLVSPDGKEVVYMLERRKADDAWVVDTDGSGSRRLTRGTSVFAASWSPSSRQVAVISIHANQHSDAHLYLVAAKGGQPRLLSDEEVVGGPAWSPDGRWIAYANYTGEIRRVHPDGSGYRDHRRHTAANLSPT